MRHRKDGRQFGRNTSHRRAMFRNLAANLVTHERIVTTDAKAKELRRVAEKLISKAKRLGPVAYTSQGELSPEDKARRLHVSRLLASYLPRWGVTKEGAKQDLIEKVMVELGKRFSERPGGYTRIVKLGARRGDGAQMSVIELVDAPPLADEGAADEGAADEAVAQGPRAGGGEEEADEAAAGAAAAGEAEESADEAGEANASDASDEE